jgi:hypothetical protein
MDGQAPDLESRLRQSRTRRAALGLVFLALPFAILAYLQGPWNSPTRSALLLSWVAVYSFVTLLVAWSRCPRCRALFFVAKPFFRVNPFRSSCGHCGCGRQ